MTLEQRIINVAEKHNYYGSRELRAIALEVRKMEDRIKQLEDWKRSALEIERNWDANAIATMLGGELGECQRKVVQREVPLLLERIKRLEDAGDVVEKKLGCGCGCYGLCKDCQSASENWFKAKEAKL